MIRAVVVAAALAAGVARGDTRSVFFNDPIGDHTGLVDVSSLTFAFDGTTGAYEILLAAHALSPFAGSFRVNVNLFNPDTGTTLQDPSFFSDTLNAFNLAQPQSELRLTGLDIRLTQWDVGDHISASTPGLGNPAGIATFWSAVADQPVGQFMDHQDIIGYGDQSVIVPEPATVLLLGLIMLACGRRVSKS